MKNAGKSIDLDDVINNQLITSHYVHVFVVVHEQHMHYRPTWINNSEQEVTNDWPVIERLTTWNYKKLHVAICQK